MAIPQELKPQALPGLRGRAAAFVEHPLFVRFITALILVNAVTLGLETDDDIRAAFGGILHMVDMLVLGVFAAELGLKLLAWRGAFFRQGWNVFDFAVVAVALVPAAGPFAVLRALRILRVLRLVSVVPQMRRIVTALLLALPGMGSIIAVLLLIYYIAAVLATQIFGHHGDAQMQELFGSIGASMYTLFQLMTLEGWAENIANPTIALFPWSWVFFVGFIVVTSFAVLNLFIGIIVDAMHIVQEEDLQAEEQSLKEAIHADSASVHSEVAVLRTEIAEIKAMLVDRR